MDIRILELFYEGGGRSVPIAPASAPDKKNIYTVVIGKNGVGKSRLLFDIAKCEISNRTAGPFAKGLDDQPKVIAASTSPFDKFPLPSRRFAEHESNYRYIGMRGEVYASTSSIGLISSAAKGILERAVYRSATKGLVEVFQAIECEPRVTFVLKPCHKPLKRERQQWRTEGDQSPQLQSLIKLLGPEVDQKVITNFEAKSLDRRILLIRAIRRFKKLLDSNSAVSLDINFINGLCHIDHESIDDELLHSIALLFEAGFVRLMDIRLLKVKFGEMSLRRASSGEQCMMVLMLGIAGHITDGSLILIDETEISLHPAWQDRFMELLMRAFSGFRRCQFVVATHSPQIVASLQDENCYILSLSRHELYSSTQFANRSVDYQLAELFDAPGIRNEYISRLAFNLLAKVKARKKITNTEIDQLSHLKGLVRSVDRNDPLIELVDSVSAVCSIYENNK